MTTFYPTGILGPHDPSEGELMNALKLWVTQGVQLGDMSSGYVDVRDIAKAIVAAMVPEQGPRRYLLWGTYADQDQLARALEDALGRSVRKVPIPRFVMQAWGKLGDVARQYGKDLLLSLIHI